MDSLAENGTLFSRAYTPNPLCMPARNSIFTGRYPHETGVTKNGPPPGGRSRIYDLFYTFSRDKGEGYYEKTWVVNPDSDGNYAGETVYRWPWLAHGTPHQGHAQIRMHPAGNRFYAIWHQWAYSDDVSVSPHDLGDDIWFRRIDFMSSAP